MPRYTVLLNTGKEIEIEANRVEAPATPDDIYLRFYNGEQTVAQFVNASFFLTPDPS